MKQIISSKGKVWIEDMPDPICGPNELLIQNIASVLSIGTEKDSIEVRKKSPLKILRERPDLMQKAKQLMSKEGLVKAYKIGMETLREPIALGYSCSGLVVDIGKDISNFKVGDHVSCMGYGANHAEFVIVNKNLCAKLPKNISFKEGAFGTLGAIAMQGVRRANISVGENIAVIGLGLIGNLTIQILKASGCNVVGFDINDYKINFSKKFCDETYNVIKSDIKSIINKHTNGYGFDKVIITASSKTNSPITFSIDLIRKKGKIILVGNVPIEIPRDDFYNKEADFLISTSYGPGRYDPEFEEKGKYMPLEYIRWSEKENLSSFLKLISEKKINIISLISLEFSIDEGNKAYEVLNKNRDIIGIIINYAKKENKKQVIMNLPNLSKNKVKENYINVGLIGVGNFAKSVHLPNLKKIKEYNIRALCSNSGLNLKQIGKKYNADYVTTDYHKIIEDDNIDLIIITTRHDTHAKITIDSLINNKHTFVEKPIAILKEDIKNIRKVANGSKGLLFVGFNRRFAPFTEMIKRDIKEIPGPKIIDYYIKTNNLPLDHWSLDPEFGGGRIIGEMIHFVDYIQYLINDEIIDISSQHIEKNNDKIKTIDDVCVNLKYKNGSIGNIIYSSIGSERFPKEIIQIHCGLNSYLLNDYKKLYIYTNKIRKKKLWHQNKGHFNELLRIRDTLMSGESLFDINQINLVHQTVFKIIDRIYT
jgi:predicted dehydrogenase/threonine dehydrogenase-like Zn-dependent dehydrogenase